MSHLFSGERVKALSGNVRPGILSAKREDNDYTMVTFWSEL